MINHNVITSSITIVIYRFDTGGWTEGPKMSPKMSLCNNFAALSKL